MQSIIKRLAARAIARLLIRYEIEAEKQTRKVIQTTVEDFEINKPYRYEADAETVKLQNAIRNFNRKIKPFPALENEPGAREIARDLILLRETTGAPIKRGAFAF